MKYGLSIDPGVSNGVCLFSWDDDAPFKAVKLWQFPLGAQGLSMFIKSQGVAKTLQPNGSELLWLGQHRLDALVVEKFTPRQNSEFKLTRDSVEPLRGEGVLIGRGLESFIEWAEPSMQYFIGSSELPLKQKKKLSREFLETHGLLITGSTVGNKDADDAISAELHAIAWLRRQRHMPTLKALFI